MAMPRAFPPRAHPALLFATLAATAGALASPAVRADVFKCVGDDGHAVYQDSACPAGRELRDFQADPPTLSVVPFTPPPASAPPPARAPASEAATQKRSGKRAQAGALRSDRSSTHKAGPAGSAAERRFLHAGMTDAEVVAKIGNPDIRSGSTEGKGGARWSYLPTEGDPGMITTVHFRGGRVDHVDRSISR